MFAGAASFLSGNNLVFLIFAAMLALLVVSGFLNRLILAGLELELLLPEHVCARAATPARIRLRNLKRFTASFSIEVSGRGSVAALTQPVYFPVIPGRTMVEAPVAMTFARRGRHRESVFTLSSRFPFGFIQRAAHIELKRETLVYPAIDLTAGVEELLSRAASEDSTDPLQASAGLDFYRIRPYLFTDDARRVDWKSTAHTGELQVREFAQDDHEPFEICLDRYSPPGADEAFERMLEDAAAFIWYLAEQDREILFRTDEGELDDAVAARRYLATVTPAASPAPAAETIPGRAVFSVRA